MPDNPLRGLVADALAWHEVAHGRSRLAYHLSPHRADAALAAIALDHAILPRTVIERVINDYVCDREASGAMDLGLEELINLYETSTGWTPLIREGT